MTSQAVIRQSELLNQLVLNSSTLEELGRVEVLWMYPQAHRVLGFICKTGFLGKQKLAFQLAQIDALGSNGILTHAQPEKTEAEKVRRLESLLDHEIWSDEGNHIGKITDCLFNLKTGEIVQYLFVSTGWASIVGKTYQLPPTQILSTGKKRVLVSEAGIPSLEIYQAGISQKFIQVREHLQEEIVQEWSSLAHRAETTTEQAKEQLQQLTEQAKGRAQRFSEQLRQKQVWEQLKERTQSLLEQAKEKGQTLGKQVEEGIETLTVHAEEIFDTVAEELPQPQRAANRVSPPETLDDTLSDDDEPWDDDWIDDLPGAASEPVPSRPDIPRSEPTGRSRPPVAPTQPAPAADEPWLDEWIDEWVDDLPPKPAHPEQPEANAVPKATPKAAPKAPAPTPKAIADDDDDEPWI